MRSEILPFPLDVKKGIQYRICACGLSETPPLCDGSHQGTAIEPVIYEPSRDKIVFVCQCQQSKKGIVCDGSHVHVTKRTMAQSKLNEPAIKASVEVGNRNTSMASTDSQQDSPLESALWHLPPDANKEEQVMQAWTNSPLLTGVSRSTSRKLAALTHVRHYKAGEHLFQEGEAGVAGGLIIAGKVRICTGDCTLATLGANQFFGEVALLNDAPRTANAIAETDASISFLVRYQLEEFVLHRPKEGLQIMTNLARLLASRLHHLNSLSGGSDSDE